MATTELFLKKEDREKAVCTFAGLAGFGAMAAYRPWQEAAFFALGYAIVFLLLEIRGKLEAIRFMAAGAHRNG